MMIAIGAAVALVTGCSWLGYSLHVGTWTRTYQTDDGSGGVVTVVETFVLEQRSFALTQHFTFEDLSEAEQRQRGDLQLIGMMAYFTVNEIGFDDMTMAIYEFLIALGGGTFALAGQEWMDVHEFLVELQKIDPDATAEDLQIGDASFSISGDTLTMSFDDWSGEYTRQ